MTFVWEKIVGQQFSVQQNVLSKRLIDKISDQCFEIKDTDRSSFDFVADSENQKSNTNEPEFFTELLDRHLRLEIITELFYNNHSPLRGRSVLKDCNVTVQKYPKGCYLDWHQDLNMGSATIFLNKEPVDGGEFVWIDNDNNTHIVIPEYNVGVFGTNWEEPTGGSPHAVLPVKSSVRSAIQIFVKSGGYPRWSDV